MLVWNSGYWSVAAFHSKIIVKLIGLWAFTFPIKKLAPRAKFLGALGFAKKKLGILQYFYKNLSKT